MRYPSDHKARTRERILTEASRAIRCQGIDRVAVANVMSAAGLTVGGFYAHFASKDDLVAHSVEHMFHERYERFLGLLDVGEPRAAIAKFFDGYLSMTHRSHPETGCPIPSLTSELAHLSEDGRGRLSNGMRGLIDGVTRLLERAGVDDPEEAANAAFSEALGALVMARMTTDLKTAEKILQRARKSVKERLGVADVDTRIPLRRRFANSSEAESGKTETSN
ncbi:MULTISPECIES: TetR/AcrR family transcriptional regulator [Sphingobium]|jgi:TetR/AcrR family transcriptional repressor of nem operon|uniref:TetR family transcriptional regulator n=2 Tax=Sphingobium fuliginis (strain ATCC 27551) TaxID=336203 RepID=A0A292ZGP2_SPHSA|nr:MULTISPECIES: TetR/AcrR family transcriptional regulator [Sphingobium]AJR23725.1 TetR family transcriptional regulator [Sphingobium sp. YBL2]MCB4862949.1 TetR/AcrR family transcriptional regulator [Sphingobium sp. PNB]PNP99817.1 TetR family transcriptional regulator [Sphingobium sp. SA916]QDC39448.1 TetR/AcrR family transcriptional regulator [Sphingobium fuliginis ATCC 27551]QOT73743.1 TetR/AcrR family transcriptional regulator [Sphingobium fuliginis]